MIEFHTHLANNIEVEQHVGFIPVISDEKDDKPFVFNADEALPVLPLKNMVLFPGVVLPVYLSNNNSIRLLREVKNGLISVFTQKDPKQETPQPKDLYQVGVVVQIIRVLEMPDNSVTVILQGKQRCSLAEVVEMEPYMRAKVLPLTDKLPSNRKREFDALCEALKEMASNIIQHSGMIPQEMLFAIRNIDAPSYFVNFIAANFPLKAKDKQELLEKNSLKERGERLLVLLTNEAQVLEIKTQIQSKAREDIEKQHREYFLQQQMKTIQDELGNSNAAEIAKLRTKAKKKKWNDDVAAAFNKELEKLERMSSHAHDYPIEMTYIENILNLPWNEYSKDNFDLKRAKRILDKEHFGMDKVKERIIEHLAVLKLKGDMKSPIICLYGPPGVGKTSLGKSIAETLNRKYVRMSLGGLHDEAEIRGHRRTYIGAMPGRIIQNLIKVGTSNPVFVLDEIDKVDAKSKGDPASALLEVLDPEQNSKFHDNYLDIDYDLSKVLFVATANNLSSIPRPLRDRMEVIEISGYILEEKTEIALHHLIPKQKENHGLAKEKLVFGKKTIKKLIENYTRESGVRELDRKIAKLMRRFAHKVAFGEEFNRNISPEDLTLLIGREEYSRDKYQGNDYVGVVTGLAWTAVGGEILEVECSLHKEKQGGKLTLTGNLGDVMKESAMLALEYVKSHAGELGIEQEDFETQSIHVHVPEGAIPKDGPSAGVTMLTAITSAFTKRKVKYGIAMTGEITLRGRVLPVGGIKEKILAAKRAGISEIILCEDNRKNIEEIKDIYLKGLTFHYVKNVKELLSIALV